jgi:hypothetical protein
VLNSIRTTAEGFDYAMSIFKLSTPDLKALVLIAGLWPALLLQAASPLTAQERSHTGSYSELFQSNSAYVDMCKINGVNHFSATSLLQALHQKITNYQEPFRNALKKAMGLLMITGVTDEKTAEVVYKPESDLLVEMALKIIRALRTQSQKGDLTSTVTGNFLSTKKTMGRRTLVLNFLDLSDDVNRNTTIQMIINLATTIIDIEHEERVLGLELECLHGYNPTIISSKLTLISVWQAADITSLDGIIAPALESLFVIRNRLSEVEIMRFNKENRPPLLTESHFHYWNEADWADEDEVAC